GLTGLVEDHNAGAAVAFDEDAAFVGELVPVAVHFDAPAAVRDDVEGVARRVRHLVAGPAGQVAREPQRGVSGAVADAVGRRHRAVDDPLPAAAHGDVVEVEEVGRVQRAGAARQHQAVPAGIAVHGARYLCTRPVAEDQDVVAAAQLDVAGPRAVGADDDQVGIVAAKHRTAYAAGVQQHVGPVAELDGTRNVSARGVDDHVAVRAAGDALPDGAGSVHEVEAVTQLDLAADYPAQDERVVALSDGDVAADERIFPGAQPIVSVAEVHVAGDFTFVVQLVAAHAHQDGAADEGAVVGFHLVGTVPQVYVAGNLP